MVQIEELVSRPGSPLPIQRLPLKRALVIGAIANFRDTTLAARILRLGQPLVHDRLAGREDAGLRWDMGNPLEGLRLLPIPLEIPIGHLNPERRWRVALANGLYVENSPPHRFILLGDRTIAQYPVGDDVQERLALINLARVKVMSAQAWAAAWGLHRNTLGRWTWRYQFFGLDGLIDGRLPARRERLEQILQAARSVMQAQGRRLTVARLGRELEAQGLGRLPGTTLTWLLAILTRPQALALDLGEPDEDEDDDDGTGGSGGSGPTQSTPPTPAADGPAPPGSGAVLDVAVKPTSDVAESARSETALQVLPMRHAGLALALPALQALLDPLRSYLEQAWGGRPWRYRPLELLQAFLLYALANYRNPEQVKAAPTADFGPLIGHPRGPACITLRRRLRAMARGTALVDRLQRELAILYLHLQWVHPGAWLVDGHFSPYFGRQAWGKAWWPQRRMAVCGYFQNWVHDRRGRPLWLHCTQGFELFADQLPLVAEGLLSLLREAGVDEPAVLVFDRGGYSASVFAGLNRLGMGWVTWLKGEIRLPIEAFTEQGQLPSSQPGEPGRTVYYSRTTHKVTDFHDAVPAIVWHDGDPDHQVALLSCLDARYPGRFSALEQIAMLEGRWAQENSFKAQVQQLDLDWTNGYAHEPAAHTLVPNPEVRRLRHELGKRTVQLRRAMDRPLPRTASAQARRRRKLGNLQGRITRIRRRLANLSPTVPYATLGRTPTVQLHRGRGTLLPALRAAAYHVRLQIRDAVAAVFTDHREWDKVLRVLISTPGHYVVGTQGDRVILQRPQLPRYDQALAALVAHFNANHPHAPGRPGHSLRFELASSEVVGDLLHNAALAPVSQ